MADKEQRQFYPGLIERVGSDYVIASIQAGVLECVVSFPRQILAYHGLCNRGDRFRYFLNPRQELGIFNIRDFEVVELVKTPIILPPNFLEGILFNPSDWKDPL